MNIKTIFFSVAVLAVVAGVIYGIVQMRSGDWKIYQNEPFGFEFKYPTLIGNKTLTVRELPNVLAGISAPFQQSNFDLLNLEFPYMRDQGYVHSKIIRLTITRLLKLQSLPPGSDPNVFDSRVGIRFGGSLGEVSYSLRTERWYPSGSGNGAREGVGWDEFMGILQKTPPTERGMGYQSELPAITSINNLPAFLWGKLEGEGNPDTSSVIWWYTILNKDARTVLELRYESSTYLSDNLRPELERLDREIKRVLPEIVKTVRFF